jgi:hypothetical protein
MSKLTFSSVFRESLPEAARFYQNILPAPFRGIHDGLEAFRRLSAEGRVGAAFLALVLASPKRMIHAIRGLWER